MKREWLDNPFWDNEQHTAMQAILKMEDDEGRVTHEVRHVQPGTEDDPNPDWMEILEQVGEEKITANTNERHEKKKAEEEARRIKDEDVKKAKKLEQLFNAKLQAFEIEEIKNSTRRDLKARLRRAKSIVEVNVFAMMVVMEALSDESEED